MYCNFHRNIKLVLNFMDKYINNHIESSVPFVTKILTERTVINEIGLK